MFRLWKCSVARARVRVRAHTHHANAKLERVGQHHHHHITSVSHHHRDPATMTNLFFSWFSFSQVGLVCPASQPGDRRLSVGYCRVRVGVRVVGECQVGCPSVSRKGPRLNVKPRRRKRGITSPRDYCKFSFFTAHLYRFTMRTMRHGAWIELDSALNAALWHITKNRDQGQVIGSAAKRHDRRVTVCRSNGDDR
jgi:hypothetical protein